MERLVYQDSKLLRRESIFAKADIVAYQEWSATGDLVIDREATIEEVAESVEYDLMQERLARKREFMVSPLGYLSLHDALAWSQSAATKDILQSLITLAIILRDRAGLQGASPEAKAIEGGLINRLKSLIGR